MSMQDV